MAAQEEPVEAGLSDLSTEEWLDAHLALDPSAFPPGELDFILDPDLDPSTLIGPDEVEVAPNG